LIFIGIDAGKEGAIGWMDGERTRIEVADTPLLPDKSYDCAAAYKLVQNACWNGSAQTCVMIEDTISVPHMARGERFLPASDKWLHYSLGMWQALFAAFDIPTNIVHPKTWKSAIFAGFANDDKAEETALIRRFAGHDIEKKLRGPNGGRRPGRVDAVAICEYARVQWRLTGKRAA
jgi:hypothetical protein